MTAAMWSASLYAGSTTPTVFPRYISDPPVGDFVRELLRVENVVDVDDGRRLRHLRRDDAGIEPLQVVVGAPQQQAVGVLEGERVLGLDVEVLRNRRVVQQRVVADDLD